MRDYSPSRGLAAAGATEHLKSTTVIELLVELDRLRATAGKPVKIQRNDYPADFEAVWEVYPDRPGASKCDAYKARAVRLSANQSHMPGLGMQFEGEFCSGQVDGSLPGSDEVGVRLGESHP